jgi:hypothetical protein
VVAAAVAVGPCGGGLGQWGWEPPTLVDEEALRFVGLDEDRVIGSNYMGATSINLKVSHDLYIHKRTRSFENFSYSIRVRLTPHVEPTHHIFGGVDMVEDP